MRSPAYRAGKVGPISGAQVHITVASPGWHGAMPAGVTIQACARPRRRQRCCREGQCHGTFCPRQQPK
jgi:hypothetical protein